MNKIKKLKLNKYQQYEFNPITEQIKRTVEYIYLIYYIGESSRGGGHIVDTLVGVNIFLLNFALQDI